MRYWFVLSICLSLDVDELSVSRRAAVSTVRRHTEGPRDHATHSRYEANGRHFRYTALPLSNPHASLSILGIETSPGGDIQWTRKLPSSCRLSADLKQRLELLLQRLLESDRNKLMTFRDFFNETDRILNLIPIYYLNLKRFTLTCTYFEPTQSIAKLYDELHKQNKDEHREDYFCLFQK